MLQKERQDQLLKILQELNRNNGVTIVMVTHDALIASYSSRLIYIKDGNIESEMIRGESSQDEYFKKIVELNSRESMEILTK